MPKRVKMLTQETLKEHVEYLPDTGVFNRILKSGAKKVAGSIGEDGYERIQIKGQRVPSHRLAFLYMTGETPEFVDHINGDRSDNRWENLREATLSQNQHNRKISVNNKSGIKGVYWVKGRNRWGAAIYLSGRRVQVGYFHDLLEAEAAIRVARQNLHGDFANHGG